MLVVTSGANKDSVWVKPIRRKEYWSSRLHKEPLKPRNRRSSRRRGGLVGHRAYGIPTMKVVVVRGKVSLQRD